MLCFLTVNTCKFEFLHKIKGEVKRMYSVMNSATAPPHRRGRQELNSTRIMCVFVIYFIVGCFGQLHENIITFSKLLNKQICDIVCYFVDIHILKEEAMEKNVLETRQTSKLIETT